MEIKISAEEVEESVEFWVRKKLNITGKIEIEYDRRAYSGSYTVTTRAEDFAEEVFKSESIIDSISA